MGGIKNKLDKLSNKTLFKVPLWLKGDVRRKSDRGIVSDTNPLGSRLPSFSQPSEMLTRNISNTRKSNWWSLCASKTIGSLRLVTLTKYLSIACLSLALISTTGLNLYRTYSSSNIESNAIDSNSEVSTLANNSSSISLSFSNATGSCSDTSNPANVCMSIPDNGGIATGGHTVTVNAGNDIASYELKLSSKTEETALVNEDKGSSSTTTIEPIISTYNGASGSNGLQSALAYESDNSWAYSVDSRSIAGHIEPGYVAPLPPISQPAVILSNSTSTGTSADSINIYYGARIDHPSTILAGNYTAQVVYTVTATLHEPTIASISPTTYELASDEGLDSSNRLPVTIAGNYLSSTSRVYLTNSDTTASNAGTEYDCTNIQVTSNGNSLTCTLPTDKTNSDLEAGTYNLTVLADNGTAVLDNAFTYTKQTGSTTINSGTVSVDIDDSMIPVVYTGTTSTSGGKWTSVSIADIKADPTKWFDYTGASTNGDGPHWANAVTVKNPENYRESGMYIPQYQIKGYWVYIPRYAYRVQRRDASNSAVSAQNFDIVFETKNDPVKQPIECNTGDYQTCVKNQYGASALNYPNTTSQDNPLNSQTAWATHPAFTWGSEELNGFWIGKFETTGSIKDPTVLPNQYHKASEYIGVFYDIAKSIGQPDPNNTYGNGTATTSNAHNLTVLSSHMLKNSEWGAVAYLASSEYGAGMTYGQSNVQNNASEDSSTGSNDGDGKASASITGCGPYNINGSTTTYNCSGDITHQYQSDIGQLASTTNNEYGVYDMAGGAWEYVMGNYTAYDLSQSGGNTTFMKTAVKPPYVDIYNITDNSSCTWNTNGSGCGGHALFETAGWSGDDSGFVDSRYPWFTRGIGWYNGTSAGVFGSNNFNGLSLYSYGFRVALSLTAVGQ